MKKKNDTTVVKDVEVKEVKKPTLEKRVADLEKKLQIVCDHFGLRI